MLETITIYHNQKELFILIPVANKLGLYEGYHIKSSDEFWFILDMNYMYLILIGDLKLRMN